MLSALFNPSSVAVIGASRETGKLGHTILRNIIASGYKGKIYPINPNADTILALKCYPDIKSAPTNVDMAIFCIPAPYVLPTLKGIVDSGKIIKAGTIISAGFRETGSEGAQWEAAINKLAMAHSAAVEACRLQPTIVGSNSLPLKLPHYKIQLLGPNVVGFIDTHTPLNATFSATPKMPPRGKTAFFSQSGAFCMAVLDWAIKEKIGLSKMVGLGNKVVVDEISLLKYLGDDPNTTCILAYLEGINNGREFMEVARKVSRTKPIVMLKGGTTDAGARAVSSHTGSLAGKDIAYQSAFLQSGIIRVQNIQDMFDLATVFERYANVPVLKGSNLAIVTNSGGPAVLAADRIAKSQSLKMSFFTEPTIATLRKALPPGAGIYNPVDVIADANRERYSTTLNTVLADKNVDGVLVIFTPASQEQPEFVAQVTGQMFKKSTKPIITSFMGGEMAQIAVKLLEELGVPNYPTPERAIAAFEAMRQYEVWKAKSKRIEQIKPINSATKNNINRLIREPLTTDVALKVIETCGIRTPRTLIASSLEQAHKLAERIGYPVALKIVSPDISHKTDVGGVKINLHTQAEISKAYKDIMDSIRNTNPQANIKGIAVQEMVTGGKEVIIGMSTDAQFGPLIMFGLGGIYVEILKDVTFRLAPLTGSDADEMIREIRAYKLLTGVRGEEPADINAIKETLMAVSDLVVAFPQILELDINPLKVFNKGVVALDARISISDKKHETRNK